MKKPDPWAFQRWAHDTRTGSPARKSVLFALAIMADSTTGRCEAKQETIATWCEMGERTVRRHLADLEDAGVIARRRQHRVDGFRRNDQFLLLAPWVTEWPDGAPVTPTGRSGRLADLPANPAALPGQQWPRKNGHTENDHSDDDGVSEGERARTRTSGEGRSPLTEHEHEAVEVLEDLARARGEPAARDQLAAAVQDSPPGYDLVAAAGRLHRIYGPDGPAASTPITDLGKVFTAEIARSTPMRSLRSLHA